MHPLTALLFQLIGMVTFGCWLGGSLNLWDFVFSVTLR